MAIMQEEALGGGIRHGIIVVMAGMAVGMILGTMVLGMAGQILGIMAIVIIIGDGMIPGISATTVGVTPIIMAIMAGDIHIITMVAAATVITMGIQVMLVPSIAMVPHMVIWADIVRWQTTASVWVA